MTEGLTIAILSTIGAVGGGGLALIARLLVRLNHRIQKLEHRDRLSWLYIKSLIDHAYRYTDISKHPLPEPPDGWLEDTVENP